MFKRRSIGSIYDQYIPVDLDGYNPELDQQDWDRDAAWISSAIGSLPESPEIDTLYPKQQVYAEVVSRSGINPYHLLARLPGGAK